jgi:hypothetical protein
MKFILAEILKYSNIYYTFDEFYNIKNELRTIIIYFSEKDNLNIDLELRSL